MKKLTAIVLILTSGTAGAASFDCKKATTLVEKEICTSKLLSRLDDALKKNYDGSLATNIGVGARQDLRNTQRQWLKERNLCKTASCIEAKYRERIDALCDYPAISGINWGCVVTSDDIN